MSETNSAGVSRRAFVTGVATAAAGVSAAAIAGGVARADERADGSWVWHGTDWQLIRPGAPGRAPDPTASAHTQGTVTGSGATGTFRSVPLGGGAHLHLFTFDDGMLIGLGRGLESGAYAIVGGTGRFAGLSGAYVAEQTPARARTEGSALFTITPARR